MKKLFTLIFSLSLFSFSFAQEENHQWNQNENSGYYRGDAYYPNDQDHRFFFYRNNRYWWHERNEVISQIVSNANYQVQMVLNDWMMGRWRKEEAIHEIREQEQREINSINAQCASPQAYPPPYRRHHEDDDEEFGDD